MSCFLVFDQFFNDRRPAPAIFAWDLDTFDLENEYATLCNLKLDLLKREKFPTWQLSICWGWYVKHHFFCDDFDKVLPGHPGLAGRDLGENLDHHFHRSSLDHHPKFRYVSGWKAWGRTVAKMMAWGVDGPSLGCKEDEPERRILWNAGLLGWGGKEWKVRVNLNRFSHHQLIHSWSFWKGDWLRLLSS